MKFTSLIKKNNTADDMSLTILKCRQKNALCLRDTHVIVSRVRRQRFALRQMCLSVKQKEYA